MDIETGLYSLKTRYYNPNIGRFISADSISHLDPDSTFELNLYTYCNTNPVMYSNPSGSFLVLIVIGSILLGGAISGALAFEGVIFESMNSIGYLGNHAAELIPVGLGREVCKIDWIIFCIAIND